MTRVSSSVAVRHLRFNQIELTVWRIKHETDGMFQLKHVNDKNTRQDVKSFLGFNRLDSSFSEAVHHLAVAVGLLGDLLGSGHLQNLPQQVERQIQRDGRLVGPLLLLPQEALREPQQSRGRGGDGA